MHFVDMSAPPFVTENARCLNTKQDSSIHKHKGESSGVLVETGPRAILTPERLKKRQNGRRMKEPEEPMFTITATDRHGVVYHGRIRRLVPRECLRLQGYYDSQIDLMTVDIVSLLQECANCRDQVLLLLLAETGFRIGELLGVRYGEDIDYKNHVIYVNFREDNENNARAKNAEFRRAKISDATFSFKRRVRHLTLLNLCDQLTVFLFHPIPLDLPECG